MNTYKQATKHFEIPVIGWDDKIWPDLELRKWQIVENMLIAAMRGGVNAVFREGSYRIRKEPSGTYSVIVSATGNNPALQGSVNGAFFDVPSSMAWTGLQMGRYYYLYIRGSVKTFEDPKSVIAFASEVRVLTKYVTLIAVADLTKKEPILDKMPPGKANVRELAEHVMDGDNPHGESVSQDDLTIRRRIRLAAGSSLEFEAQGKPVSVPAESLLRMMGGANRIVDFKSGGPSGTVLRAGGKIIFVNVMRIERSGKTLGEVSFGMFGSDSGVSTDNEVIVVNAGDSGISMRAMIICE